MKLLVSWLYAPAFLLGFIGWGLYQPRWLLVIFAAAVAVSFLTEQWLPYEPQWNRSLGDRRRDTLHALVNESLNALGLLVLPGSRRCWRSRASGREAGRCGSSC